MTSAHHFNVLSYEEFNELSLIAALSNPDIQYLQQQGWNSLTLALGLGPKSGHTCARFASHQRLPVNLDTIRTDPLWKVKALEFLQAANTNWSRRKVIHYLYSRILKEIWVVQTISRFQRCFRAWTYSPGNPGYLRRNNILTQRDNLYSIQKRNIWFRLFCCRRPRFEEPDDWSD